MEIHIRLQKMFYKNTKKSLLILIYLRVHIFTHSWHDILNAIFFINTSLAYIKSEAKANNKPTET